MKKYFGSISLNSQIMLHDISNLGRHSSFLLNRQTVSNIYVNYWHSK